MFISKLSRPAPSKNREISNNNITRAKLNKIGLETIGDISWPEHVSIFTAPIRFALSYKIPLILYGENPQIEYGGPKKSLSNYDLNRKALEASKSEIVTVAIRRINLTDKNLPKLTDFISPKKYTFLPNTAGCFNANEAIRTLRLAKDLGGWNMVKLEVLSDEKTLYPNMIETINASEKLVADGFKVLAYCNDDPVLCKILEETGCSAIMPLGSPIGSGLGILNPLNIKLIIEQSNSTKLWQTSQYGPVHHHLQE